MQKLPQMQKLDVVSVHKVEISLSLCCEACCFLELRYSDENSNFERKWHTISMHVMLLCAADHVLNTLSIKELNGSVEFMTVSPLLLQNLCQWFHTGLLNNADLP